MTPNATVTTGEMSQAQALPQLDASSLVDGARLEAKVKTCTDT